MKVSDVHMGRTKVEDSILVTEKSLLNRLDNFYKIIYENFDEPDLKDLMVISLTKISFCNYLLYGDNYEDRHAMFRFKAAIEMVNKKYDTNYTVNDFFMKL